MRTLTLILIRMMVAMLTIPFMMFVLAAAAWAAANDATAWETILWMTGFGGPGNG